MNSPQTFGQTVEILGVQVSRLGFDASVELCARHDGKRLSGYVCFANVHSVTEAKRFSQVREALNRAFLALADGVPLLWSSQLKGERIESRVCGPDFMKIFLERRKDEVHGFIGGASGQAEKIAQAFGVQAVCYSPPMRPFQKDHAAEDWLNFLALCPGGRPPAYVWVGLGAPKQELWMHSVSNEAFETLFFGVGAAFDFLTGTKSRAPLVMQRNGLEWLYRLVQEPRRLWKRYLVTNTLFVVWSLLEAVRKR